MSPPEGNRRLAARMGGPDWRRNRHGCGEACPPPMPWATVALSGGATALVRGAGFLGGHLTFRRGIGVDHTVFEEDMAGWTPVLAAADLVDGVPTLSHAGGNPVLVVSQGETICVLPDRCSHAGAPCTRGPLTRAGLRARGTAASSTWTAVRCCAASQPLRSPPTTSAWRVAPSKFVAGPDVGPPALRAPGRVRGGGCDVADPRRQAGVVPRYERARGGAGPPGPALSRSRRVDPAVGGSGGDPPPPWLGSGCGPAK